MYNKKKWLKILGIAVSFPSTILITGWGSMQLAKLGVVSDTIAKLIFIAILFNTLFLLIYYAVKK